MSLFLVLSAGAMYIGAISLAAWRAAVQSVTSDKVTDVPAPSIYVCRLVDQTNRRDDKLPEVAIPRLRGGGARSVATSDAMFAATLALTVAAVITFLLGTVLVTRGGILLAIGGVLGLADLIAVYAWLRRGLGVRCRNRRRSAREVAWRFLVNGFAFTGATMVVVGLVRLFL